MEQIPVIRIKRAYDPVDSRDGYRVLVDRLWPRGLSREAMQLDEWCKVLAPSTVLRQWLHEDLQRWPEFVQRYEADLRELEASCQAFVARLHTEDVVTLLYASKDVVHNHAQVLQAHLERMLEHIS